MLICAAVLCLVVAPPASATADTIELVVHGGTGEIWLHNHNAAAFDFIYYSISSIGGALDGANGVWTSIADTYDVSGDGSVDPNSEWFELSDGPDDLTEGTFGAGGTLAVDQLVSLGAIWNPAVGMSDLSAEVFEASASATVPMSIVVRSYASDFNLDFNADYADLATWRSNFGTGTLHIQGDADMDGDVDGDDFLQWQQDAASMPSASGGGAGAIAIAASSVPEPAAAWLLCAGGGAVLLVHKSRRRR